MAPVSLAPSFRVVVEREDKQKISSKFLLTDSGREEIHWQRQFFATPSKHCILGVVFH